jgi:hypothetical protein
MTLSRFRERRAIQVAPHGEIVDFFMDDTETGEGDSMQFGPDEAPVPVYRFRFAGGVGVTYEEPL